MALATRVALEMLAVIKVSNLMENIFSPSPAYVMMTRETMGYLGINYIRALSFSSSSLMLY